jgi:hypothetical protein
MSGTSAKSLLGIMTVRHDMQVKGITHPQSCVVNATKELVEKLAKLDPTEAIDVVVVAEDPIHAQYIRAKTVVDRLRRKLPFARGSNGS